MGIESLGMHGGLLGLPPRDGAGRTSIHRELHRGRYAFPRPLGARDATGRERTPPSTLHEDVLRSHGRAHTRCQTR